jgi:hypothetical protein
MQDKLKAVIVVVVIDQLNADDVGSLLKSLRSDQYVSSL